LAPVTDIRVKEPSRRMDRGRVHRPPGAMCPPATMSGRHHKVPVIYWDFPNRRRGRASCLHSRTAKKSDGSAGRASLESAVRRERRSHHGRAMPEADVIVVPFRGPRRGWGWCPTLRVSLRFRGSRSARVGAQPMPNDVVGPRPSGAAATVPKNGPLSSQS
jgi:hypothetical protein